MFAFCIVYVIVMNQFFRVHYAIYQHVRIYNFFKKMLGGILARAYNFDAEPASVPSTPYLVIANHVTNYDPILLGIAFDRHMYFVAGEHLHRGNLIMRLAATHLFSPISRIKGKSGATTTIRILKTLKSGANVCLFAEGNTTFNGITDPVSPSTGKLARISGATLVTYRIEGAYLASPRWGRGLRKGPVTGRIVNIYPPERLQAMSESEITEAINSDIYEDAFERQAENPRPYSGKRIAERLELALYICPNCTQIGTLKSVDNTFFCECGFSTRFSETGFFEGKDLPFTTIKEWDAWQDERLTMLAEQLPREPLFSDKDFILKKILDSHKAVTETRGRLAMSAFELICGNRRFPITNISGMAIHGPANLVFNVGGDYYELRPGTPQCARKYYALYNKLREIHQRRKHMQTNGI